MNNQQAIDRLVKHLEWDMHWKKISGFHAVRRCRKNQDFIWRAFTAKLRKKAIVEACGLRLTMILTLKWNGVNCQAMKKSLPGCRYLNPIKEND
jgi:hypothetical protein